MDTMFEEVGLGYIVCSSLSTTFVYPDSVLTISSRVKDLVTAPTWLGGVIGLWILSFCRGLYG